MGIVYFSLKYTPDAHMTIGIRIEKWLLCSE